MKRTQLITLLLVLFTGIGVASAKPKIAVLGLEVLDKTNLKPSVEAARQLTDGMRQAAKVPGGPFDLADNSSREFFDEKIINGCESEQRDCLIKIAGNFGAAGLMYGKLQLADNKKSFKVDVWLLTVDKGTTKSTSGVVSITATAQEMQIAGKKLYGDLAGTTNQGSIVIKAKASKGIVYINGDMKGQLVDGEYKATALADGEYKVRIAADGFKKWEDTVKVKSGQATPVEPDLEAEPIAKPTPTPTPTHVDEPEDKGSRTLPEDKLKLDSRENTVSKGGGRKGWKIAAIGGAATAAVGGGWLAYEYFGNIRPNDKKYGTKTIKPFSLTQDCGLSQAGTTDVDDQKKWAAGCRASVRSNYAGIVLGVGGVVAIVGAYMGYVRGGDSSESSSTASHHSRKQRFAVTPILSPDGAGATVRLDF
jgi:PEGA domain